MAVSTFEELISHKGHSVSVVTYGNEDSVAIECDDCYETLLDFDNEEN